VGKKRAQISHAPVVSRGARGGGNQGGMKIKGRSRRLSKWDGGGAQIKGGWRGKGDIWYKKKSAKFSTRLRGHAFWGGQVGRDHTKKEEGGNISLTPEKEEGIGNEVKKKVNLILDPKTLKYSPQSRGGEKENKEKGDVCASKKGQEFSGKARKGGFRARDS